MNNTGKTENPIHLHEQNETDYKDLFDAAHDLIHIVKPDGAILYVNNAWLQTLGYSMSEIQGKSVYDFVDAADKKQFIQYRDSILANTAAEKETVLKFTAKSGKKIMAEGFVSAKYKDGALLCTRGIFRDITARIANEERLKQLNAQLTEREANLQQLITYAPDAIIVIDTDSNIIFWNPKAEQMFGWTADEVTGQSLSDKIIPPASRDAHNNGMKRYLATGVARVLNQTIEVTAINKKGDEFYISLTISNSKLGDKGAFISFIRDITQQKMAEQELEKKRKELEASNLELEQYAWLTSHDLREPLRKIITFSDILLTRDSDAVAPKATEHISKIYNAAMRMNNLIQSVLAYSSFSVEAQPFEKTDLAQLITEVLADLEVLISSNNAIVTVNAMPVIEAIPFQMQQLFQNLISNAIKYGRDSTTPQVQVEAENLGQGMVRILVKDNGIGIDAEDIQKIFGLFQRLQKSGKTEGSGVGLAICKKIVETHNGSIAVESVPGAGTTFIITLPVQQGNIIA